MKSGFMASLVVLIAAISLTAQTPLVGGPHGNFDPRGPNVATLVVNATNAAKCAPMIVSVSFDAAQSPGASGNAINIMAPSALPGSLNCTETQSVTYANGRTVAIGPLLVPLNGPGTSVAAGISNAENLATGFARDPSVVSQVTSIVFRWKVGSCDYQATIVVEFDASGQAKSAKAS